MKKRFKLIKSFFIKHKRPVFYFLAVCFIVFCLRTASITGSKLPPSEVIDRISTVSKPSGMVVAQGVDLSSYQSDVDFEKLRADGYSFVILRAGSTGYGADSMFEKHYADARAAGLDIGCYYYTYSTTVEGVRADASELLDLIKGKNFTYPVFLDFEEEAFQSSDRVKLNTEMVSAFCASVKRGGYYPGVYTMISMYEDYLDVSELENKWDFWIANYIDGTHAHDLYKDSFSLWQYTSEGYVLGIDSQVDLNVAYVDYPKITKEFYKKLKV